MPHTPTPWDWGIHEDTDEIGLLAGDRGIARLFDTRGVALPIPREEALANAELIVRAVNSHDALVGALEDCAELLDHIHQSMGRHNCTVDCPDIGKRVRRAGNALALAKGGQPVGR